MEPAKKMERRIGIVLCIHNGAPYLATQLESVASQRERFQELLISDDASSDASVAIAERFKWPDVQRVDFIRRRRKLGAAPNFSDTLSRAKAELVFLCDQDDVWRENKIEVLVRAFATNERALLVASDAALIDGSGQPLRGGPRVSGYLGTEAASAWSPSDWMYALLRRNRVTGATCAVRRRLLEFALPVPDGFWHDEWLTLVAAACDGVVWLDHCLTDYRIHDGNAAGLRGVGMSAVVTGAITGGVKHYRAKAEKLAVLGKHLRSLGDRVIPERLQQVDAAAAFWQQRACLPPSPLKRAAFVAETLRSRGYAIFGDGFRSALRDLLGA